MGFLSAPEIPTTDGPLKYAPSFDTSFITERFQPIIGSTLDLGRKVFRIDRTIGAGAFGDVFQVTDIKKGRQLAAKALPRRTFTHIPSRKNEVVIMSLLYKDATDLFPSVHTILASDDHEFILMELLTLNLDDRFRYAPPSMWQIRFVFRQMLNALDRLRELEICHFDVKPQNIMITSTGRVKLIDFSCAYFDQDVVPQMIMSTTSFIRAPEIVLRYRISHEVDMWSLGITMLKLYLHRAPVFAAVDGLLLSHHEAYMLASWEKTFGPIPDHLIEESVEKNQYYTRSEDGCYKLLPYRRGQVSVNGCKLKTLKPYYMPERKRVDIQRQNAERELFLDLISKVLVYEKRPSSKEALNHPFFDMSKVNKGVTFEETVGHEPEWMMS